MVEDSIAEPISLEVTGFLTVFTFCTIIPNITPDILRDGIMLGIWHTSFALGCTFSCRIFKEMMNCIACEGRVKRNETAIELIDFVY